METLINDELFMFTNSRMANNSYVILNRNTALVIDPSWNGDAILSFLSLKKIKKVVVFITHCHYDHIVDIDKIINKYPTTKFFVNKYESEHLRHTSNQTLFKSPIIVHKDNIKEIGEKQMKFVIDGIEILTFYNPGHSKGSTSYIYKNYIFTGDFIFSNCIGRTDLLTGNLKDMINSLKRFINFANDENVICPGHNEISIFRVVKVYNDELIEYSSK